GVLAVVVAGGSAVGVAVEDEVTPPVVSSAVVGVNRTCVVVVGAAGVVVVVGSDAHTGAVITLESSVVAPLRASRRPATVAFVFAVIEVSARMVPTNAVPVPRVAELPTCQNTLQACAPFSSATALF